MQRPNSDYIGLDRSWSGSDNQGIRISAVLNENWRGKNDPAERRRIQNRLNQRAFRQRQRAGECPKQYKPRSMSGNASQSPEADDDLEKWDSNSSTDSSLPYSPHAEAYPVSATLADQPAGDMDTTTGKVWDELARTINRNLMAAAVTNAQHLGIDMAAMRTGTPTCTPRPRDRSAPATLNPVQLQYQIAHDPFIDIIPHARLRYNILRAITSGQVAPTTLSSCIRGSGTLVHFQGSWVRGGVVVWSFPEQVASWELSEPFVTKWAFLLQGCEDLIAATNAWRNRRGEKPFPLSLERSDVMMSY